MNYPTVAKEERKNKNGGGSDYLLVNHQDTSGDSV